MKPKRAIAAVLHRIAWSTGLSTWRARSLSGGRIIMLHGIGGGYPAARFEQQLRYLIRHFRIVSLHDFVRRLESGNEFSGREIVLTFDDGLRNNFTVAYPILKKLSIPATFFICPGVIDSGRWLWTHEARARLEFLDENRRRELLLKWKAGCAPEIEPVMAWLKQMPAKRRREMEESLRCETREFCPTPRQREEFDLMSWNELRSLDPSLMTIGSHTLSHPILPMLSKAELDLEIRGSRSRIEEELGRPVEFFCYPNGSSNPDVVETVRENHRAAVATLPDFVRAGTGLHLLPRIGVTERMSLFAWRLHRPGA